MLYRENSILGKPIGRLSFGGAALSGEGGGYGFGEMTELDAERLLKMAQEIGINLFDTAPIYGFGLSEERIGRYLSQDAMVVTKGGVDWHPNRRVNMSNDPAIIEKMFFESLKRLNRESIDIYMIHWPDSKVDIRRPMEVLKRFQDKGQIQYLGLCNTTSTDLALAQEVAPISVLQSELNLFRQAPFDDLGSQWKNYFTMGWGTLDKGILSGRVFEGRKFDQADARSWAPWWNKKEVKQKVDRVKQLSHILSDYQIPLVHFCLNFNLNHFGISSCLVGAKKKEDWLNLLQYLPHEIPSSTMEEILQRFNKVI